MNEKITTMFKIYDAMMGSGKTTELIRLIDESNIQQNYMYITPLLSECHRIAGTYYDEDDLRKRPIISEIDDTSVHYLYKDDAVLKNRRFKHPDYKGGNKSESLQYLLKNKENIVSTHQLFMNLTTTMLKNAKDYILIVDETLQVYDVYDEYNKEELEALFRLGWIILDNDGVSLRFRRENFGLNGGDPSGTRYETLASMCDLGQLLYIDEKLIVWELSIDTLKSFKEVWIATYMFEGNQMSSYLKSYGIEYELIKFGKKPSEIKHLININEDKFINSIGAKPTSLSTSDFSRNSKSLCEQLSKNLDNYFRTKVKAKKNDRLWTCITGASITSVNRKVNIKSKIQGTRYSDEWLAFNTKATNEYKDRHYIAYLCNLFPNPMIVKASALKGYPIKEDIFALSELVQFIWRSAIRQEEQIYIYIPSIRMRSLLKNWLDDKYE